MQSLLPEAWQVPAVFRRRLGATVGRQRAMESEGHLLLVLHAPPDPEEATREPRIYWCTPQGNWRSSHYGDGDAALERHLGDFAATLAAIDEQLERARHAKEYFAVLRRLVPLHRTIRNQHAALQQAREKLSDVRGIISFRDRSGDLEREAELLHADARNGMDFTVAREAEEQSRRASDTNRVAHRLNVLAAMFLPLATLSSVMGMDNYPPPLADWVQPHVFWGVVAAGVGLGILLTLILGRRPRRRRPPKPA